MLFVLGKALHQMWILINVLQFFVFMSMWQINYPMLTYIILNELRRIALGELVDDLKAATKLEEKIGLSDGSSVDSPL